MTQENHIPENAPDSGPRPRFNWRDYVKLEGFNAEDTAKLEHALGRLTYLEEAKPFFEEGHRRSYQRERDNLQFVWDSLGELQSYPQDKQELWGITFGNYDHNKFEQVADLESDIETIRLRQSQDEWRLVIRPPDSLAEQIQEPLFSQSSNAVVIDPTSYRTVRYLGVDGEHHEMSLERKLLHEIGHARQDRDMAVMWDELQAIHNTCSAKDHEHEEKACIDTLDAENKQHRIQQYEEPVVDQVNDALCDLGDPLRKEYALNYEPTRWDELVEKFNDITGLVDAFETTPPAVPDLEPDKCLKR